MAGSIRFEDLIRKITTVATAINRKKPEFLFLGGKDLEGRMKSRIFNKGLDAAELEIGPYKSKSWIRKREKKGFQVKRVDLQFTGGLKNSLKVIRDGDDVYLAFDNDTKAIIAEAQEETRGKIIFEPTPREFKAVQNYINDLIEEEVENQFKNL